MNEDKSIEDELFKILRYEWKVKKILALFQMKVACSECGGICLKCAKPNNCFECEKLPHNCPTCKGEKTEIVPYKSGVEGMCL